MNNTKIKKLHKKIDVLKKQQQGLKKTIKDTHVEIEWLDREMNTFKTSQLWKFGNSLKNRLLLKK